MIITATVVTLVLFLMTSGSLLIRTTQSLNVAVLGSGIAGSAAARILADAGVKVTYDFWFRFVMFQ